jgi:hypothetical protein
MRALHHPHLLRRRGAAVVALALTAVTGGCGFTSALAHPASSSASSAPTVPASASASASATDSATPAPAASAAADLVGSTNGWPAALKVSAIAAPTDAPTNVVPGNCHLPAGTTEYATISVVFANHEQPTKQTGVAANLRLDLAATGGSGVGILAYEGDLTSACDNAGHLPTSTAVQSQNLGWDEHQTFTVYLVGPTAAAGADRLHGITLELRHPRHQPDDIDSAAWTWTVQHVTGGSVCPGDAASVCVPLG